MHIHGAWSLGRVHITRIPSLYRTWAPGPLNNLVVAPLNFRGRARPAGLGKRLAPSDPALKEARQKLLPRSGQWQF